MFTLSSLRAVRALKRDRMSLLHPLHTHINSWKKGVKIPAGAGINPPTCTSRAAVKVITVANVDCREVGKCMAVGRVVKP